MAAAATTKIKGRDLMVFKKKGEGQYASIAHAKNHTLNMSRNELDVSDKDSGEYGDTEPGQATWTIDSENTVVVADTEALIDAFNENTVLDLVWNIKSESELEAPSGGWTPAAGGYEGKAIITSISVNAPAGDAATCNVTFKGKGAFKKRV